jgi:hypothetical protein
LCARSPRSNRNCSGSCCNRAYCRHHYCCCPCMSTPRTGCTLDPGIPLIMRQRRAPIRIRQTQRRGGRLRINRRRLAICPRYRLCRCQLHRRTQCGRPTQRATNPQPHHPVVHISPPCAPHPHHLLPAPVPLPPPTRSISHSPAHASLASLKNTACRLANLRTLHTSALSPQCSRARYTGSSVASCVRSAR